MQVFNYSSERWIKKPLRIKKKILGLKNGDIVNIDDDSNNTWNDEWITSMVKYYEYNWLSKTEPNMKAPVGFFWDGELFIYQKGDVQQIDESNSSFEKYFQL